MIFKDSNLCKHFKTLYTEGHKRNKAGMISFIELLKYCREQYLMNEENKEYYSVIEKTTVETSTR